ncbi:hypothetical protein ACAG24_009780 [Mycobacterium sp. pW049]|uniref:hypothetical protein n=1 Tax=[Mycobacterium] bulgaricum TaxID=3238985 RepID=UPI00351BEBAF
MKIDLGGGTPIFVSHRQHDGGVTVIQGTARLRLRPTEVGALIDALRTMTPSGQGGGGNAKRP